jgi:hypothetical protein
MRAWYEDVDIGQALNICRSYEPFVAVRTGLNWGFNWYLSVCLSLGSKWWIFGAEDL